MRKRHISKRFSKIRKKRPLKKNGYLRYLKRKNDYTHCHWCNRKIGIRDNFCCWCGKANLEK